MSRDRSQDSALVIHLDISLSVGTFAIRRFNGAVLEDSCLVAMFIHNSFVFIFADQIAIYVQYSISFCYFSLLALGQLADIPDNYIMMLIWLEYFSVDFFWYNFSLLIFYQVCLDNLLFIIMSLLISLILIDIPLFVSPLLLYNNSSGIYNCVVLHSQNSIWVLLIHNIALVYNCVIILILLNNFNFCLIYKDLPVNVFDYLFLYYWGFCYLMSFLLEELLLRWSLGVFYLLYHISLMCDNVIIWVLVGYNRVGLSGNYISLWICHCFLLYYYLLTPLVKTLWAYWFLALI